MMAAVGIRSLERATLFGFGLSLALAMMLPVRGVAAQEQSSTTAGRQYEIPADRLDLALAAYADISNVDIIYDNALANGRRSSPVSGRYSPPQALAILLSGTGLSWRFTQARAVVIFASEARATEAETATTDSYAVLTLDTLRVTASRVIGAPSPAPYIDYSEWVLSELYRRILPQEQQARPFRGEIQFWIDDQGVVSRLEFLRRTGDSDTDQMIASRVIGTQFDRTPPPGLPQPLRFRVEGRR